MGISSRQVHSHNQPLKGKPTFDINIHQLCLFNIKREYKFSLTNAFKIKKTSKNYNNSTIQTSNIIQRICNLILRSDIVTKIKKVSAQKYLFSKPYFLRLPGTTFVGACISRRDNK